MDDDGVLPRNTTNLPSHALPSRDWVLGTTCHHTCSSTTADSGSGANWLWLTTHGAELTCFTSPGMPGVFTAGDRSATGVTGSRLPLPPETWDPKCRNGNPPSSACRYPRSPSDSWAVAQSLDVRRQTRHAGMYVPFPSRSGGSSGYWYRPSSSHRHGGKHA
jgi:hypothetical protein